MNTNLKPTNKDHVPQGEGTAKPEQQLGAPAALCVAGATYSYDDVVEIATRLRLYLKFFLDEVLNEKFGALLEPCHVYFGPVVDSSTTVPAFLYNFQVAWFPSWFTGPKDNPGSYLRNSRGWLIIDSYLDAESGEADIGIARATSGHEAMFIKMANAIVDVLRAFAKRYQEWLSATHADHSSAPTTDQVYLGLEELLDFFHKMPWPDTEIEATNQRT